MSKSPDIRHRRMMLSVQVQAKDQSKTKKNQAISKPFANSEILVRPRFIAGIFIDFAEVFCRSNEEQHERAMLALIVTIASRMEFRDKWSVSLRCADQIASEI